MYTNLRGKLNGNGLYLEMAHNVFVHTAIPAVGMVREG